MEHKVGDTIWLAITSPEHRGYAAHVGPWAEVFERTIVDIITHEQRHAAPGVDDDSWTEYELKDSDGRRRKYSERRLWHGICELPTLYATEAECQAAIDATKETDNADGQ